LGAGSFMVGKGLSVAFGLVKLHVAFFFLCYHLWWIKMNIFERLSPHAPLSAALVLVCAFIKQQLWKLGLPNVVHKYIYIAQCLTCVTVSGIKTGTAWKKFHTTRPWMSHFPWADPDPHLIQSRVQRGNRHIKKTSSISLDALPQFTNVIDRRTTTLVTTVG